VLEHQDNTDSSVVVDNFFKYLKQKGITQKEYASIHSLDGSILSKWKKGDSLMSLDQIIQAAKFFDITVNDLVYSDKDKKKLMVLKDQNYQKIVAQQSLTVKHYGRFFQKPLYMVLLILFAYLLFGMIANFTKRYDLFAYGFVLMVPSVFYSLFKSVYTKKHYIIDYLDDIFYMRTSALNEWYLPGLIIKILSSFMGVYYLVEATQLIESNPSNHLGFSMIVLSLFLFYLALSALFDLRKKFKLKIKDTEFMGLFKMQLLFITQVALTSVVLFTLKISLKDYLPLVIISGLHLILLGLDYCKTSLSYQAYRLYYQENDQSPKPIGF